MALSLGASVATRYKVDQGQLRLLSRGRLSPVGRDLEIRTARVVTRMRQNASGRPGPEIRTKTLVSSISSRIGEDTVGLYSHVGPLGSRTIKRGANYALVLEGVIPRGPGGRGLTLRAQGGGGVYPFIVRSMDAAK